MDSMAKPAYVRENGKITDTFLARCPDKYVTDKWCQENVIPNITDIRVNTSDPDVLEETFWSWWLDNKNGSNLIVHCGHPVETGLFQRCVMRCPDTRSQDAPYPAIYDDVVKYDDNLNDYVAV